jgi:hypothetical protein
MSGLQCSYAFGTGIRADVRRIVSVLKLKRWSQVNPFPRCGKSNANVRESAVEDGISFIRPKCQIGVPLCDGY